MPNLFISYRREDSAYPAHSICERLKSHFGKDSVFIDVDTIPYGADFRKHLNDAVGKCDVLLAVIGNKWLDSKQEDGTRRLDDPRDFVRIEIEAALHRDIHVIPVLVDQVGMPKNTLLPEALSELAFRNAAQVRPGLDFNSDLDRLVRGLQKLLKLEPGQNPVPSPEKSPAPQQVSAPVAIPITVPPASKAEPPSTPQHEIVETGDIITNSIGLKLTLIPAGEFLMGSPRSDRSAGDSENPQHLVGITTPFYLGVYPVTHAEYEKVTGDNLSQFRGNDRCPVEKVSWFDAVDFCNELSELEQLPPYYNVSGDSVSIVGGIGYRLPTEAEWEYACRAETTTRWSFGDNQSQLQDYAWFDANSGKTTHPVGKKKPNPWGLHDMHGNVWEWCWDWEDIDYYKDSPANDPMGPIEGDRRVLRGGSFVSHSSHVRSARRDSTPPPVRIFLDKGFRLARTLPPIPLTPLPPTP